MLSHIGHPPALHFLPPFSICQETRQGLCQGVRLVGVRRCIEYISLCKNPGIQKAFLYFSPPHMFVSYTPLPNLPNLAASPLSDLRPPLRLSPVLCSVLPVKSNAYLYPHLKIWQHVSSANRSELGKDFT